MHHPSDSFEWTIDAVERLKALWAEGHATAEIGRRLGVSKNAVVGKSHRLSLAARPSPIKKEGASQQRPHCPSLTNLQARPASAGPASPVETSPVRVRPAPLTPSPTPEPSLQATRPARTALVGRRPCCWPEGEPGTRSFRYCEAPSEPGKPYCPTHCVAAYQNRKAATKAA